MTGANSDIGAAVARELATAGANVLINCRGHFLLYISAPSIAVVLTDFFFLGIMLVGYGR